MKRKYKTRKTSKPAQVQAMMQADPNISVGELMTKLHITRQYAYNLMSMARKQQKITWVPQVSTPPAAPAPAPAPVVDVVNHPPHYKVGGIETIDFIEAKGLNYHLGNVVKYITRADHKGDRLENLKKAQWYLTREIAASEAR